MRKLIPALLALPLLFPSAAYPLGLGDIRLHSALNQRFSGEIDLLSVRAEEAESIEVSLGSYETFARLGIDRVAALNHLEFEVVQRPNGGYYVQVTSERPIREPFLDFLIEVNWSSGRLLREYTVLLDPPELMKEGAPAVAAPASAPAVQSPKVSEPRTPEQPSSPTQQNPPATASKSTQEAAQTRAAPAPAPVAATSQIRTHRVVKGETLSGITRRLRPGSGTDAQVMMALLKANPEAFYDNNINRLKAGAVLRLDPALVGEMSRAEAAREVARQARAWQDYKQKAAQQAKGRPATEPTREPGKAVAAAEESRLKLVAPEEGGPVDKGKSAASAPGTAGPADLQQELALALEAAEAHRQQNAELQKRMTELEGQLADMQRLLTLKNDDLAALQRQLKGEAAVGEPLPSELAQEQSSGAEEDESPETVSEGAEGAEVEANAKVADGAAGAPEALDEPNAEAGAAPTQEGEASAGAAAAGAQTEIAAEGAKPAEATQPVKPPADSGAAKPAGAAMPARPAAVPQPPKSMVDQILDDLSGMIEDIAGDPILAGVIGGGSIFILILLYIIMRRRSQGGGFQESILTAGETSSLLRAKQAEGEASEEQSFFSDFAVSGMGDIQADDSEVDPLTEAGLYMDFGRYQQAEELLKEAARHNPESAEVKATLLEVYYKTENREAFELLAVDSQTMLTKTGLWDKVLAMGHELAPGNPVFGNAPAGGAALGTAAAASAAGAEVLDIGLDEDALSAGPAPAAAGTAPASDDFTVDLGVDFSDLDDNAAGQGDDLSADGGELVDLDFGFDDETPSDGESVSGGEQSNELDFDLGGLDMDGGSDESVASDEGSAGEVLEFGGFDMEETAEPETPAADSGGDEAFGLGDLELGDADTEISGEEFQLGGLDVGGADSDNSGDDFDLGGVDLDTDDGLGTNTDTGSDFDLGGLDLGADEETVATASDDLDSFDFGGLDLGGDDDGATMDAGDLGGTDEFGGLELGEETGGNDLGDFDLGSAGGDDFGDDDLFGELDEIGTKLDLAKAYVDMGDGDGARSILEEVLQDGDDAQKGQAQELMKQIA